MRPLSRRSGWRARFRLEPAAGAISSRKTSSHRRALARRAHDSSSNGVADLETNSSSTSAARAGACTKLTIQMMKTDTNQTTSSTTARPRCRGAAARTPAAGQMNQRNSMSRRSRRAEDMRSVPNSRFFFGDLEMPSWPPAAQLESRRRITVTIRRRRLAFTRSAA